MLLVLSIQIACSKIAKKSNQAYNQHSVIFHHDLSLKDQP